MNKPDYQKQEAKQSLWDNDGFHIQKKYRVKGSGRNQEKKDIRKEIEEFYREEK